MYPRSMFTAKIGKNITIFYLKKNIVTAMENRGVLHGRVFVMLALARSVGILAKSPLHCFIIVF